jgi:hypothetical protein
VSRIVVAGGRGGFGALAVECLLEEGAQPLVAARRPGADVLLDVENAASIRAALRAGDVVLDAAGPFQHRSPALVAAAAEVHFHVVDLSDSLVYAASLDPLGPALLRADAAVLTSCSTVSTLTAAALAEGGGPAPTAVRTCLVPSARSTARRATTRSLLASVGVPIAVLRRGALIQVRGWTETRTFPRPAPQEPVRGALTGSADALLLPRSFPSLREVGFYVATGVPGFDRLLRWSAHSRVLRAFLRIGARWGAGVARRLGASQGALLWELTRADGAVVRRALVGSGPSRVSAVLPAALAACALAAGRFPHRGLVPPHLHVEPEHLRAALARRGLAIGDPVLSPG